MLPAKVVRYPGDDPGERKSCARDTAGFQGWRNGRHANRSTRVSRASFWSRASSDRWRAAALFFCVTASLAIFMVMLLPGCGFFLLFLGDCASSLVVRGQLVDDQDQRWVRMIALGGRSFTAGEFTGGAGGVRPNGEAVLIPPEDGSFEIPFAGTLGPCVSRLAPFPRPDRIDIIVTREALPAELDLSPALRSGQDLRIVCPCEETSPIEVNEATAEFFESDEPATMASVLTLMEPVVLPPVCEACCCVLILRGQLSGVAEDVQDLRIEGVDEMGDTQRTWVARRQMIGIDNTFEAWFAESSESCPPGETFVVPDRLAISVRSALASGGTVGCVNRADLDTLDPVVSIVDPDGSFPRTVVELEEPVVLPQCPP